MTNATLDKLLEILKEATNSGRGRLDSDEWEEEDYNLFKARFLNIVKPKRNAGK